MSFNSAHIMERLKGVLFKECCICGAPLFTTYLVDGYGNAACHSHADDIIYCASCSRMCGKDLNPIGAGRFVCGVCKNSIPDDQSCQRIVAFVKKVLSEYGLSIPDFHLERIPAEQFSRLGHPSANGLALRSGSGYTVYTLRELINTALAEVLAHEMTHTWQWENNVAVKEDICEGFCNLVSFLTLREIDTEMARIKIESLERNPDKIYGDGFRKVKEYFDKNGMENTIRKMKCQR